MAKTESRVQLKKGDTAPEFELPGIDGRSYGLHDFDLPAQAGGREGLLVLFMCNHCPYVKARMGEVAELYKEFGLPAEVAAQAGGRISFVGINSSDPDYPGEGMEKMKVFAKERDITFPYLLDEDGRVAKAYGATCTPDPFLFGKEMELVFHGRISDALEPQDTPQEFTMRENMQKLLKGKPIEPWFNPSLGCSIKFKS